MKLREQEIEERAYRATDGPWYMSQLDDSHCANLIAVSTEPDPEGLKSAVAWPNFSARKVVAATLVQFPNRYADIADGRWIYNASFIAHSRQDIPYLLQRVRELEALLYRVSDCSRNTWPVELQAEVDKALDSMPLDP